MKKALHFFVAIFLFSQTSFAQLIEGPGKISGTVKMNRITGKPSSFAKRSATNPTQCGSDTSYFVNIASTSYSSLLVSNTLAFGQFFDAPQEITISGFRFYAYLPYDTGRKVKSTYVKCSVYEAGGDSLPTGSPLATELVRIDTVQGNLLLTRIARNVVFSTPVKTSKNYILTVECDSSQFSRPGLVTNSWANGDGEGRNINCAKLQAQWYRGLTLNVGGVTFDCHIQLYPFVKYKFGTDFTHNQDCYANVDTLRMTNSYKKNVSGSVFYNQYMYYDYAGFDAYCHNWVFDKTNFQLNSINGKFRPSTKKNVTVELRSMVATYSSSFCYDTTTKIVRFKPNTPTFAKGYNACIGDSLRISMTPATDVEHQWFNERLDKTPFHTSNNYTISKVSTSDSFYVYGVNGECKSRDFLVPVVAKAYPTKLTTKNDSLCSGASANLEAKSDNGNLDWYRTSTGGTKFHTGTTYTTVVLNNDTTFYVEAQNGGCTYKMGRVAVSAFVGNDFAPDAPTAISDTSICYTSGNLNLKLSASNNSSATIRWFDVPNGGSPLATGTQFTASITKRGTQTYYVESYDGNCGSGRITINVNANQAPPTFAKIGDEICIGDSADVAASTQWGNVNWYTSKSGSIFASSKFVNVKNLNAAKSYIFFKTIEGKCENNSFDSVLVTVNIPPTPSTISAPDVCNKSLGLISAPITYGNIYWYEDETTNNSFSSSSNLNLGILFSDKTVYYQTEFKGCTSERKSVTINTKFRPTSGFQWTLDYPRKVTCTPAVTNPNSSIQWLWGDGNTSSGATGTHQYATDGTYDVQMIVTSNASGCKDTAIIQVIADHLNNQIINIDNVSVYPNPVDAKSNITINGIQQLPSNITWFDLTGRAVGFSELQNNQYQVPSSLKTGLYIIKSNSNKSNFSARIQVTE
jgi:hypothetical protein